MDGSSLRHVIEKPPVGGKELLPLNSLQMTGFRLHSGPLPEQLRSMYLSPQKKKHKKHKHKHKAGDTPSHQESSAAELAAAAEKKHKKQKRHDDDKERKKRKKEKKKKKQKHSPEHPSSAGGSSQMLNPALGLMKTILE
jgi:mediator of RNA polymerase II transcription subunit 19